MPECSPKFVNRTDEIEYVLEKVKALCAGSSLEKRTIVFTGTRGIGKTWFLECLHRKLQALPNVTPIPLKLTINQQIQTLKQILLQFGAAINIPQLSGTTYDEMGANLIAQLPEDDLMVVLIDSVYEADWYLLIELEEYLLAFLATCPNVLFVMTGRGRPYSWKTPELRLRAEEPRELKPFSNTSTDEQLKRLQGISVSTAPRIHELSGGTPLVNRILLGDPEHPENELNQAIDEILSIVPDPSLDQIGTYAIVQLLAEIPDKKLRTLRHYVRACLEALCVLRSFDSDERVGTLLAAYYRRTLAQTELNTQAEEIFDKLANWEFSQAQQIQKELMGWGIARWDEPQGGYVLDESIRGLIERYLQEHEEELLMELHQAAATLYTTWAGKYHKQQARWGQEATYHLSKMPQIVP